MTDPTTPTPEDTAADAITASRIREQALDWFVRRRDAQGWGEADEQGYQAWLAADARHREALDRWQGEWQAFDAIPPDMRELLRRNLAFDQAMVAAGPAGAGRGPAMPSRRRVLAPALAIAVVGAVAGAIGWQVWGHWQAQPVYAQSFSTPRGQQAEVPLPDGTRVRLDTATRLQATYYRQRREITLIDGQAVFAVQADATRPFHVLAGPLRVTVVGTRFSVRHTPGQPGVGGVQVAVEEGQVRVARQVGGDAVAVLLAAGQQVSADAAGTLSAIAPVAAGAGIAPWREHRVRFDNQRLDHALAELRRYRDVPWVIRDPAVAALRVTGVFDPRDLATIGRVLPASLPVRLRMGADGLTELVPAR